MQNLLVRQHNELPIDFASRLYQYKLDKVFDLPYDKIYELAFDEKICYEEAMKRLRLIRDNIFYVKELEASGETFTRSSSNLSSVEREITLLRDERNDLAKLKRDNFRLERLRDLITNEVSKLNKRLPLEPLPAKKTTMKKIGILQLSDIHYGLSFDNGFNKYDLTICQQRMDVLVGNVLNRIRENNIDVIYVLLQGDLISGNIKNVIRLQNQTDIISQIIGVSELISQLIYTLSLEVNINVVCVGGNHERVTANKDDNLQEENYIKLIKWFLEERFIHTPRVWFLNNQYGDEIATFQIFDYKIGVVHGHHDNFRKVVSNLTTMTKMPFDFIFTGHNHSFHCQDIQRCRVIANASLSGTDVYSASDLRLTSFAGQNFTVLDNQGNLVLYPITLN